MIDAIVKYNYFLSESEIGLAFYFLVFWFFTLNYNLSKILFVLHLNLSMR